MMLGVGLKEDELQSIINYLTTGKLISNFFQINIYYN